jgi:hypothetical protein
MMGQQLTLDDYMDVIASRDAGMIAAEFAERLSGSTYPDVLYAAICHVARRQCEVHADDVLPLVNVKPSHPNSAGSGLEARNEGRRPARRSGAAPLHD